MLGMGSATRRLARTWEGEFIMVETIRFIRRDLPHWLVADRTYFVTLRLYGTLPNSLVRELSEERAQLEASGCCDQDIWLNLHRAQFAKIDAILDSKDNDIHWLTKEGVPEIILNSFDWLEKEAGWKIYAATVLSTHVHVVMRNENGRSGELLNDLEKFKRFSGTAANRALGRKGRFWARDDFDHWCRTPDKVRSAVNYVRQNSVKAGLVRQWQDWPWTVGGWEGD